MNLFEWINIYYNYKNITASKTQSKLDYQEGSVNIYSKLSTIHHDSYTKREKIYNKDGIWIDTKPLLIHTT